MKRKRGAIVYLNIFCYTNHFTIINVCEMTSFLIGNYWSLCTANCPITKMCEFANDQDIDVFQAILLEFEWELYLGGRQWLRQPLLPSSVTDLFRSNDSCSYILYAEKNHCAFNTLYMLPRTVLFSNWT